ncbi:MAG: hypothetical protein IT303_11050 [Dehalococcoidia bacterium]|nr:hypothetical protein [Dehalococcoidia bacterium]
MTTVLIALALLGYGAAVLAPGAVVAWGLLQRFAALGPRAAGAVAFAAWVAALAPPLLGLAADELRQPITCDPGEECYDYIFWVLGVPTGWAAAALILAAALASRPLRSQPNQ